MSKHNTNSVFLFFFSPVSSWRPPRSTCGSGEYINPASCLCTSVTSQQWGRELCISFLPLCVGFHPQLHVCSSVLLPVSCRLFMVISCLRAEAAAARHAERLFTFNQNYLKQSWAARSVSGLVTSEVTAIRRDLHVWDFKLNRRPESVSEQNVSLGGQIEVCRYLQNPL